MHETVAAVRSGNSRRFGAWCAGFGCAAWTAVLGLWLFNSDPAMRRSAILISLGCVLACATLVLLHQRRMGGRQQFSAVAAEEFATTNTEMDGDGDASPVLPRTIPSRWGQVLRTQCLGLGAFALCTGLLAMAAGTPQRPDLVERIQSAGADFAQVPVGKVIDSQYHDPSRGKSYYVSTAVVRLPDGTTSVPATVSAESHDELRPGDRVSVLYAPAEPRLGAVAGDEHTLGHEVRGDTLPRSSVTILLAVWGFVLCVAIGRPIRALGLRSFSRLGRRDKAVRGTCSGARKDDKAKGLGINTGAGTVHFLLNITEHDLPPAVTGQPLWLSWDARHGSGGRSGSPKTTPAVLVSDAGWVAHGSLKVAHARTLSDSGAPVEKLDPSGSQRPLRLWDPHAQWPRYVGVMTLGCFTVAIACAALLMFDVSGGWRWAVGFTGFLCGGALLAGSYLGDASGNEEGTQAAGGLSSR
ncbi:hypothetical protein [Streptomyces sp. NPDC048639]|uniref:hypothetical protein n=1 Tax=Streptomyces sp. NPDC048639 TaxID=3365581 RepID=UPI0037152A42